MRTYGVTVRTWMNQDLIELFEIHGNREKPLESGEMPQWWDFAGAISPLAMPPGITSGLLQICVATTTGPARPTIRIALITLPFRAGPTRDSVPLEFCTDANNISDKQPWSSIFMHIGTKKDQPAKRPRGRPRAYEPDVALRQAANAFWKAGYAGTSLDDISAATGMNRPSLRAAFGDKHEIYVRALRDYWAQKFAAIHAAIAANNTLGESLMRVYDAALSIYFSGDEQALGCFVVSTAITEAPGDAVIHDIVAEGFSKLDAAFETRFKKALKKGELKPGADPKALALLATATMQTLAVRARSGTPRGELRKLAQKAINVMCA